jgi:hypothetical protein
MGVIITANPKTIERWYRNFCETLKICIPLKEKHNLSPFLELNPDVLSTIKEYSCSKLSSLRVDTISKYVHHAVLPIVIENKLKDAHNEEIDQGTRAVKKY